ncbi:hypothetical protein ACFE04_025686 [Oxalis oulophora]
MSKEFVSFETMYVVQPSNAIEEEVDVGKEHEKEIFYSKTIPTSYLGNNSENGESSHFVRCQTLADPQDDNTDAVNLADRRVISEEVKGTPQNSNRESSHEEGTPRADSSDDDDDGDDIEHPGQRSVGKKLWTFLTT